VELEFQATFHTLNIEDSLMKNSNFTAQRLYLRSSSPMRESGQRSTDCGLASAWPLYFEK
jgi:hypothetical protein